MNALSADVDPDERVTSIVIDQALADDIPGVEKDRWMQGFLPLVRIAQNRILRAWTLTCREKKEIN